VDDAVRRSIADGVSYVVSAGNGNRKGAQDACRLSPGRLGAVLTIGAVDKSDRRAGWSNYGSCVDLFAPGVSIRSAGISSRTAGKTLSGTSQAAPFAAGVAALYLDSHPSASPSQVQSALVGLATKNIVSEAKSANDHLLFTNL
jgi:subtilisin family serine protease